MESVVRLAGRTAHDFNNLLHRMMGCSELLLSKSGPTEPNNAFLKEIYNATIKVADLICQLLAFAKNQTIAPKTIKINQGIESMLKMLWRLIGENFILV